MELDIGSNVITNTTGILTVQGKKQISLEVGERSDQLLLNMDIYDPNAKHIAKLNRNAWVFNEKERFEITTSPQSLKLIDKESGDTVVEANVISKDKIRIHKGKFYSHKGQLLEITPKFWRIAGGIEMSGVKIDGGGLAVKID